MVLTAEDINHELQLLRQNQSDTASFEVKRAAKGIPNETNICTTLCAFANMPAGGVLVLGIGDETTNFEIYGVPDPGKTGRQITDKARSAVAPPPVIETYNLQIEGKTIVVVEVPGLPLALRPARFRGIPYLRQADGDYKMSDTDVHMVEVAKLNSDERVPYDEIAAPNTSIEDLDKELVKSYLAECRRTRKRLTPIKNDQELLRLTRVINSSGELTVAGLYAMGIYPQGPFPALAITAAVRTKDGSGKRAIRNLERFEGPVPILLEELMEWVRNNISYTRAYDENGNMADRPEFALNAARELIANAIVHRDLGPDTLGVGKSIDIRLDQNKLIVSSPGGLRGIDVSQLTSRTLSRAAVNQRLYSISQSLYTSDGSAIIEGEGGGIREVLETAKRLGSIPPIFRDTGVSFTAIIWPTPAALRSSNVAATNSRTNDDPQPEQPDSTSENKSSETQTKNGRLILSLLEEGKTQVAEISEWTQLPKYSVRYALNQLIDEGLVYREGGRGKPNTSYHLTNV